MMPIIYLSGYCAGALPPIPRSLGAGAPIPDRNPTTAHHRNTELPQLGWALERHGLDPRTVMQEEVERT